MNRTEARRLGNELKSQGKSYREIAAELGKRGYRTQGGKAPEWYDVNYLLNAKRYIELSRARRRHARAVRNGSHIMSGRVDMLVLKEIAFNDHISCEDRINIIMTLLEPKRALQVVTKPFDKAL